MATSKGKKEKALERARKKRSEAKEARYREYFHENKVQNLWDAYREKVREGTPHAKLSDASVVKMIEVIQTYERYVKDKERQYKREIERQNKEIRDLRQQVKDLEAKLRREEKKNNALNERLKRMEKASKDAEQHTENLKKKRKASFRGDDPTEKMGERASASKDSYGELLAQIEEKKHIYMHPNRAKALAGSAKFRMEYTKHFTGKLPQSEIEEIWNYHFGDIRTKENLSQFGLASDEEDDWTYEPSKVYRAKKGRG